MQIFANSVKRLNSPVNSAPPCIVDNCKGIRVLVVQVSDLALMQVSRHEPSKDAKGLTD